MSKRYLLALLVVWLLVPTSQVHSQDMPAAWSDGTVEKRFKSIYEQGQWRARGFQWGLGGAMAKGIRCVGETGKQSRLPLSIFRPPLGLLSKPRRSRKRQGPQSCRPAELHATK